MALKAEWYAAKCAMLASATGVGMAIFDAAGLEMWRTGGGSFCDMASTARCRIFHADAAREALRVGEAYIARCPFGAVAITAPIISSGKLSGSAAFMPMRMWDWDAAARAELAACFDNIDTLNVITAGENLPQIDAERSKALMALILDVVSPEATELEMRRILSEQQRRINELIGEKKAVGEKLSAYPMHIEREMLSRVRFGDRNGARALLNELLGHIFYRAPGNIGLMKARVLELVVVISRAAVESGAELESLLGLNYDFVGELSGIDDFEDLCAWVVRMLNKFLDTVSQTRDAPGSAQLNDALTFIRANQNAGLSLEEVAKQAHVSPYYLSHLFREKLGVTFVEYVTGVKIETAKNYLAHTRLPISAIAEKLGYDDPGYFGKVFRRISGMTPNQYRKNA